MKIFVENICARCLRPGEIILDTDLFNDKNEGITKCSNCYAFIALYRLENDINGEKVE